MTTMALLLISLLRRAPRTWPELRAAGLERAAVLAAIGELLDTGACHVRLGPLLVELESAPDPEEVLP